MSSETHHPEETPEDADLFRRARSGDAAAREALVQRHWNLVWHIVHRFAGRGYEAEDLFQVGAIGLLKAIDRFEVDRGLRFSTYAVPLIMGEIRRYLRDDQPIRVARSLRELAAKVEQTRADLTQKLGREPSAAEIAEDLKVALDEVTEALEAARPVTSLNQVLETPSGSETELADSVAEASREADWLDQLALSEAFRHLDARERYILRARFIEGRTQMDISKRLHISQVQVSRLERRALDRLKMALQDSD
ncbi:MAG: SigB/SigF/SigG family RNA polymerase sigma factor [Firmicutes bacterium]|nr:SigB/SigF/SigG family RNA polymerase sigma factor [Alicyclobacillaceae bacterium]MCL6496703.1 SigB/SigF/SigG family RNA polymerase sigma factor [Bacillota bacterium]